MFCKFSNCEKVLLNLTLKVVHDLSVLNAPTFEVVTHVEA